MKKLPYLLILLMFFCLIFLVQIYFLDIKKEEKGSFLKKDEYSDFYSERFKNSKIIMKDGLTLNLMKLNYKMTIIAFMTKDCPACHLFYNDFIQTKKRDGHRPDMNLIFIVDENSYQREENIENLLIVEDQLLFKSWRVQSIPTFFVFEEDRLIFSQIGYEESFLKKFFPQ